MERPKTGIPLPAMDLKQMVEAALWNVDYHFYVLTTLLSSRGLSALWEADPSLDEPTKHNLQGEVNRFHAHLRGFFWELVAAYDAMRVFAQRGPEKLAVLKTAGKTDWYTAVHSYRNFAHKCFLIAEGSYSVRDGTRGDVPIMLIPAGPGRMQTSIPDGLMTYKDNMRALFKKVLSA